MGSIVVVVILILVLVWCRCVCVVRMLGCWCISLEGISLGRFVGSCSLLSVMFIVFVLEGNWLVNMVCRCVVWLCFCFSGGSDVFSDVNCVVRFNLLVCVMMLVLICVCVIFICLCIMVIRLCVVLICV